jgi:hypothetical protein
MIYEEFEKLDSDRTINAVIGMNKEKFDELVIAFEKASIDLQEERLKNGEIKRIQSGGNKGFLDTFRKQLFFILFYLKTYVTFDVLGFHFGLSGGNAHDHVKQLLPVLERSLAILNMLPSRPPQSPEEFIQLIEKLDDIVIDCTECACVRPQDEEQQKAKYSGKKKRHTVKSLIVCDLNKKILIISFIVAGSMHDYALMKGLFDPKKEWFNKLIVWLDLGFFGANKDYNCSGIHLPHKKPKKSKKNKDIKLKSAQIKENRLHVKTRIIIENAIGGMKVFYCLTDRIRNHLDILIGP